MSISVCDIITGDIDSDIENHVKDVEFSVFKMFGRLTPTLHKVACWTAMGYTQEEIANALGISNPRVWQLKKKLRQIGEERNKIH